MERGRGDRPRAERGQALAGGRLAAICRSGRVLLEHRASPERLATQSKTRRSRSSLRTGEKVGSVAAHTWTSDLRLHSAQQSAFSKSAVTATRLLAGLPCPYGVWCAPRTMLILKSSPP